MSLCQCSNDCNFIATDGAKRIENSLDREGITGAKIHFAKEMEVYALGVNDKTLTSLVPVALVPTCKKDYDNGDRSQTNTVKTVFQTMCNKYHQLGLDEKIGPLSTGNSDGAGHFQKGAGQMLSDVLPNDIRVTCSSYKLFDTFGGDKVMTMACDLDHLGKRFRARVKTDAGIALCEVQFTKIDLAQLMAHSGAFENANVNLLFNPQRLNGCE